MPRGLDSKQNRKARAILKKLAEEAYADNYTAAAKAFGVSQATVSDAINGNRRIGPKLLAGIAELHPAVAMQMQGLPAGEGTGSVGELIAMETPIAQQCAAMLKEAIVKVDRSDRSEARAVAACFASALEFLPQAISEIRRQAVPKPDLPVRSWIARMRQRDEELRLEPSPEVGSASGANK